MPKGFLHYYGMYQGKEPTGFEKLRLEVGLTQSEMLRRAGVVHEHYRRFLDGSRPLPPEDAAKLRHLFEVVIGSEK